VQRSSRRQPFVVVKHSGDARQFVCRLCLRDNFPNSVHLEVHQLKCAVENGRRVQCFVSYIFENFSTVVLFCFAVVLCGLLFFSGLCAL